MTALMKQMRLHLDDIKVTLRSENILDRTSMLHGPDGDSLLCGACGNFDYVVTQLSDVDASFLVVSCPSCKMVHRWFPHEVLCASPHHNDSGGCSSVACWKYSGGAVNEIF